MGTDNFHHKQKEERTEPLYFKSFPLSSVSVKVEGVGTNTLRLVQKAIEIRDADATNDEIYDQVWVVMDRDDFPAHNFNNALDFADKHNPHNPEQDNPCTTVHLLVQKLHKYIK